MKAWVLIIIMKFVFTQEHIVLPTPEPSTEEKCKHDAPIVAEWLTQEGVSVETRCVEVDTSTPA
jgi:hypothetical protein